jgi:HAD superfamily hydrolase (TIGR01509 family)
VSAQHREAREARAERRPIEAVIFDLDGVVVDSEIWWDEVRHGFAGSHGRSWTADDQRAVMGANSRQWSETMRNRLDLDIAASEIEAAVVDAMVERYGREGAPAIDGAVETVRRIATRWPVALASSSHRAVIDAALAATGLADVFRAVVSSDEVERGKPAPDVFLEAARRLDVDPRHVLVVEDSYNGLAAARAAGMRAVLVPNQAVPPAPGSSNIADQVLARITDLDPDWMATAVATLTSGHAAADGGVGRAVADDAPAGAMEAAGRPQRPPRPPASPDRLHPFRRALRTRLSRRAAWLLCHALFRPRLEGRDRLPEGRAIYCFNHLSWIDPFVLMATLPLRPRLLFFGPKEEDMSVGGRNRLMAWTGATIPYRPGKGDLLEAARRVHAAVAAGSVVAIAGEGRIQPIQSRVGPLSEGPAWFAIREQVPIFPVAIIGTSWLGFGRRIIVRVGAPIPPERGVRREAVDALTVRLHSEMRLLVAEAPPARRPGRFGRWLTELFNEWPEGTRAAAETAAEDALRQGF